MQIKTRNASFVRRSIACSFNFSQAPGRRLRIPYPVSDRSLTRLGQDTYNNTTPVQSSATWFARYHAKFLSWDFLIRLSTAHCRNVRGLGKINSIALIAVISGLTCRRGERVSSALNRPRSIYQYSDMAPRLSGQNCKFFKLLLYHNSQRRLGYKENNTKYRSLT